MKLIEFSFITLSNFNLKLLSNTFADIEGMFYEN